MASDHWFPRWSDIGYVHRNPSATDDLILVGGIIVIILIAGKNLKEPVEHAAQGVGTALANTGQTIGETFSNTGTGARAVPILVGAGAQGVAGDLGDIFSTTGTGARAVPVLAVTGAEAVTGGIGNILGDLGNSIRQRVFGPT